MSNKTDRLLSINIKQIFNYLIGFFDISSKIGSGLLFLFAFASFMFPETFWRPVESLIASRNGLEGYVYYEVGEDRSLTCESYGKEHCDGQLFLLKNSKKAKYEEIKKGDRLIVNTALDSKVNFRISPNKKKPAMFVLNSGKCVIVTEEPSEPRTVENAVSGGWLKVATTSCGLFN